MGSLLRKTTMPTASEALPGRPQAMDVAAKHFVNGNRIVPPYPAGHAIALFGMGCFWGAERRFWKMNGVQTTAVGYAGGYTPNPSYEEVCTGRTGHSEVVLVVYRPDHVSYEELLRVFWEAHDPTQGMRQGNDVGTQYRSGVYFYSDAQKKLAEQTKQQYEAKLLQSGYESVTTEVQHAGPFYYAEDYHQQYLAKNPHGYCGLGGTGVCFA